MSGRVDVLLRPCVLENFSWGWFETGGHSSPRACGFCLDYLEVGVGAVRVGGYKTEWVRESIASLSGLNLERQKRHSRFLSKIFCKKREVHPWIAAKGCRGLVEYGLPVAWRVDCSS